MDKRVQTRARVLSGKLGTKAGDPCCEASWLSFVCLCLITWLFLHSGKQFNSQKGAARKGGYDKISSWVTRWWSRGEEKRGQESRRSSKLGFPNWMGSSLKSDGRLRCWGLEQGGDKAQFEPFALEEGPASFLYIGAEAVCLLLVRWLTQRRKWGQIFQ